MFAYHKKDIKDHTRPYKAIRIQHHNISLQAILGCTYKATKNWKNVKQLFCRFQLTIKIKIWSSFHCSIWNKFCSQTFFVPLGTVFVLFGTNLICGISFSIWNKLCSQTFFVSFWTFFQTRFHAKKKNNKASLRTFELKLEVKKDWKLH